MRRQITSAIGILAIVASLVACHAATPDPDPAAPEPTASDAAAKMPSDTTTPVTPEPVAPIAASEYDDSWVFWVESARTDADHAFLPVVYTPSTGLASYSLSPFEGEAVQPTFTARPHGLSPSRTWTTVTVSDTAVLLTRLPGAVEDRTVDLEAIPRESPDDFLGAVSFISDAPATLQVPIMTPKGEGDDEMLVTRLWHLDVDDPESVPELVGELEHPAGTLAYNVWDDRLLPREGEPDLLRLTVETEGVNIRGGGLIGANTILYDDGSEAALEYVEEGNGVATVSTSWRPSADAEWQPVGQSATFSMQGSHASLAIQAAPTEVTPGG